MPVWLTEKWLVQGCKATVYLICMWPFAASFGIQALCLSVVAFMFSLRSCGHYTSATKSPVI